jgi:hypothetical protein
MTSTLINPYRFRFDDDLIRSVIGPSALSAVFIKRTSSLRYDFYQEAGLGRYWRQAFNQPAVDYTGVPAGYDSPHSLGRQDMCVPALSSDQGDASFSYSGTWAAPLSQAGTYGGTYRYSNTTGSSFTWTSPAACTIIGHRHAGFSNCGLTKVLVDGDATAANLLPTAQDYVDAGTYANTILIANGGTLNPTDRVWSLWPFTGTQDGQTNVDQKVLIADNLANTTHTVQFVVTGYKTAAASSTIVTASGMFYGSPSITPTTASSEIILTNRIHYMAEGVATATEISHRTYPTAGTPTWAGGSHGYEGGVSLAISLDGTPTTMTDGQILSASEIVITKATKLFHPNVGAGSTATCDVTYVYTFDQQGLQIDRTDDWLTDLSCSTSYAASMTMNQLGTPGFVDKYANSGIPGDTTLTANDNGFRGMAPAVVQWFWKDGGNLAASLDMFDETNRSASTNNDALAAPDYEFCQDYSVAGSTYLDKCYVTRVSASATPETITSSSLWSSSSLLRARWVSNTSQLSRA